ncbi:MAG: hypothetical protein HKN21_09675, partial [Candidatus Eisenbacteria bacterium]|nr:hypothetical protein [Candidatus Eisenbacteria bacterium]
MKSKKILPLVLMLSVLGASAAFAGGPLLVFDPATQTPFAYGAPTVDFWTDTGPNGVLSNAQMDVLTANGVAAWSGVATSSFTGVVAGDNTAYPHAAIPGDINSGNVGGIINTYNNGDNDIHVIYDHDGLIVQNFFGAPPGVLGIASPDFSDGTANLIEGWAVLNGATIDPGDVGGASWNGVVTHEFGHSINLAHSQTNGANGFFGDSTGPDGCNPLPWAGGVTFNDFETMYPFIDPSPGSVGIQMADINVLDDINSISNIYPGAGWPANFGSISGTIYLPDGVTELTGANVVARNVADPYEDAVSALSGDYTQGALGPDGRYNFNGLTPGACYVVFVNGIVNGGFSTSPATVSPEEFYNGANENGQVGSDDPCES